MLASEPHEDSTIANANELENKGKRKEAIALLQNFKKSFTYKKNGSTHIDRLLQNMLTRQKATKREQPIKNYFSPKFPLRKWQLAKPLMTGYKLPKVKQVSNSYFIQDKLSGTTPTFKKAVGFKKLMAHNDFTHDWKGFEFAYKSTNSGYTIIEAIGGVEIVKNAPALGTAIDKIQTLKLDEILAWNIRKYGISPRYEHADKSTFVQGTIESKKGNAKVSKPTAFGNIKKNNVVIAQPVAKEKPNRSITQAQKTARTQKKREAITTAKTLDFSMDIPYETAYRSYTWNSFSPEIRAKQVIEDYNNILKNAYEAAKNIDESLFKTFRDGFKKRYLHWLNAKSKTASPMVTGPAKFPVEKNRKALDREHAAMEQFIDYKKNFYAKINKYEKEAAGIAPIKTGANDSLERLQQKLSVLEKNQKFMIEVNKILRAAKDEKDAVQKIQMLGRSEKEAKSFIVKNLSGKKGFEPFYLANNTAEIRRIKGRIEQEKRIAATKEETKNEELATLFEGGKLVKNFDIMRIQFIFDGKPTQKIIDMLKRYAFRWARSEKAWQRHLNENGVIAAKEVLKVIRNG